LRNNLKSQTATHVAVSFRYLRCKIFLYYPLFLLTQKAQREKLAKEKRRMEDFARARATAVSSAALDKPL
jgi:hypothetical protein